MEPHTKLRSLVGQTDIYLLDQILKGRYTSTDKILDAGCGPGRNMCWFIANGIAVYGNDQSEQAINHAKHIYTELPEDRLSIAPVNNLPYPDCFFDHVLSIAVLHFAVTEDDYLGMVKEMVRVLKPGGTFFLRMTTAIGNEPQGESLGSGVYRIPDGSTRFLLTDGLLNETMVKFGLVYEEPFKAVNVNNVRVMCAALFKKL
ncbi:MAG: class I SAM-dependent methyltransferase [Pedobacter sp.]|nr:MAG: class I SAM-dependent methyltransferase [Pedobacter sp.]